MSADDTMKSAIDEAIAPLVADHHTYLAGAQGGIPVARADLHYVYDQYGTQLLDFSNPDNPAGHRHPFVLAAIIEHLDYYLRTSTGPAEHVLRWPTEYAKAIVETFTPEDHDPTLQVLFTEGEREAVLTAIDVAGQIRSVDRLLVANTGVHDWVEGNAAQDFVYLPTTKYFLDAVSWDQTAAVLLSLVTRDGTILDPRWVQEVVSTAKVNGVPVIIDESHTGFGRFGTTWGQQHHQVDADITVLGGPLGGSLALGAVVAPAKTFRRVTWDVSPQSGSPVACAAGANTLRAINPGVVAHSAAVGVTMASALADVVNQFPEYVAATHGTGLWQILEFQSVELAENFAVDARAHGLLVAPHPPRESSVILTPTLIASTMEILRGVNIITDVLLSWYDKDNSWPA